MLDIFYTKVSKEKDDYMNLAIITYHFNIFKMIEFNQDYAIIPNLQEQRSYKQTIYSIKLITNKKKSKIIFFVHSF
jgi:hypothetical protein